MAYNHGREDRKWRIWKEAEEKLLRECGVDEATIEQIRIADRADFNSNRRFYRWTNDIAEYLEDMADRERQTEVGTVAELLEEIESENLYQVLVTVDVLFPKIGEIIGGSEREADYEKLSARVHELGMNEKELWWYLDTRRWGSAPHSGFGLGFERLLLFVTGMGNIRDVIPFPRTPKNAEF